MTTPQETRRRLPAFAEVGLGLGQIVEGELPGTVEVLPTMWASGSRQPMISIAATWVDTQLGMLAIQALEPRLVVTLELDVHLFDGIDGATSLRTAARIARAGSSVVVARMDITTAAGARVGFGHGTFMAAPDPTKTMPSIAKALARYQAGQAPLDEPFARRVGCERTAPGEAVMPVAPYVVNGTKAIQGGLLTATVEEAARSADPGNRPLAHMHVRYLRPVRVGPAVARAAVHGGIGEVDVHDSGTGALALIGTTHAATS
ncbi:hypothetical protein [Frankia sp. R43]|uniref:hypothetical protein n=1 Tax=Frankia sp. R43 TaxID=269536 RepID=UPI001F387406|nr:hypothetical protein [Frankia sp. R43]